MVTLRRLVAADAAAYRDVRNRGLKEFPEAFSTSYEEGVATSVAKLAGRITGSGDDFVLGAFLKDGTLVGFAGFHREELAKQHHKGMVRGMYVAPAQRGTGLGKRLLLALIDEASRIPGLEVINLTVTHSNAAARQLYLSVGFASFGVEPMALREGDAFHAKEHMQLRLRRA